MFECGYVEAVSHETVRQTLKKNELKPWLNKSWVIPPPENAEERLLHGGLIMGLRRRTRNNVNFIGVLQAFGEKNKELFVK